MKLSFSSNAFVRYSIPETLRHVSEIGYEGIELLADAPHLYADTITADDLHIVKKIIRDLRLSVSNINANTAVGWYGRTFWEPLFEPSLANPDMNLRSWRIDYTKKCVDIAEFLGATCISVTSGRPVSGIYPEESVELLEDSLKQLIAYGEQKSVRIGMEYEPGLLIESADELIRLLERMDSAYLGVNLDLGHSYLLGENPVEVINKFSSRIFHVHLEDIIRNKHYHRIPGTGDICFEPIFEAFSEIAYDGFLSVELYTYQHDPVGAATESIHFLKRFIELNPSERPS